MRYIKFDLKRIFSRPSTYFILFLAPIIFVVVGSAFFNSLGTSDLKIGVYSEDKSPLSKFTVGVVMSLFQGSTMKYVGDDYTEELKKGELQAVVIIPDGFTSGLFGGKKTQIVYVPSPVDTHVSAAAYTVFKRLFEDLSGGPFFNPKVLQQMYTSPSVPAPELVTEKALDFTHAFAPSLIFIITMFVSIMIGSGLVVYDKEKNLFKLFQLGNLSAFQYIFSKIFAVFVVSVVSGVVSYLLFLLVGFEISALEIILLIAVTALFHSALGVLISAVSSTNLVSNILGASVSLFLLLISGSLAPISALPRWGEKIVSFVPIYSAVYSTRLLQLFPGSEDNFLQILITLLMSLIGSVLIFIISALVVNHNFMPKED
ncbi:MAG TPA: ABC transporter permease [Fervidobacterium sp.]|nr:ABC transporter permease [Fervidobacterium sp.]HPT53350.1 ABC transporter permease [Fervidobacterium sp.]HPZ17461.1 ABC transporter permease [Fervidobacterium sp.]HQE47725.1 ABC transporter permease [Fervidobacterium sp.]HUM41320.1 ABC transporter permease [Fervidobacterium sp.]